MTLIGFEGILKNDLVESYTKRLKTLSIKYNTAARRHLIAAD